MKSPVKGYQDFRHHGRRSVTIRLDDETFDQINKLALEERTSFGEQVRLLIEWGLMESNAEKDNCPW